VLGAAIPYGGAGDLLGGRLGVTEGAQAIHGRLMRVGRGPIVQDLFKLGIELACYVTPNIISGMPPIAVPAVVRYRAKFDTSSGPHACWPWTARCDRLGYGSFWDGTYTSSGASRMVGAHRWGYTNLIEDPGSLHVLHTCDFRACQNPNHWFLGTHQTNMADREAKGRGVMPDGRGFVKGYGRVLTAEEVIAIRARSTGAWGEQVRLAREFGLSHQYVSAILSEKVWRPL
jgi:hypothetical protein